METGRFAMIGKAERAWVGIEVINTNDGACLTAAGSGAWLQATASERTRVLGVGERGTEAIGGFDVQDMPVAVAVSANVISVRPTEPKERQSRIGKIPVAAVCGFP